MLSELEELDESRAWPRLFQRLNWEASQKAGSLTAARLPENRQLNRYRDVLPYDHSRIILKEDQDYINANLVEIPRLNKKYILTQGPLPHTAKHFWQMIWEQNSEAVIMLNKVIEKNQIKCFQYWPCGEAYGHVNHLEFGDFRVYYLRELRNEYFTIRSLELENILTGERRPIDHFHYLTWPDFGVPTSPATFLAFLFEVRKTGVMSADVGPCVIHCSAGIGRSGTFVMVDSVLTEIELNGHMDQIDIKAMLLEIRQYRVGLIQTPDQLRFTYLAILEGARVLMPEIYHKADNRHFQQQANAESEGSKKDQEDAEDVEETPPPLPPRRRLEATDEPVTKKSRTSEHGMSISKQFTENMERNKSKSKMRHLFHFLSRGRKRQTDSNAASQLSSDDIGRLGLLEPEADKEVFSDESEGSDEIINLSSLSESESDDESVPIEDLDKKVVEETQPGNDNLKQTKEDLQPTTEGHQYMGESLQSTDEVFKSTEESLQSTDEVCKSTEESLQSTDEVCKSTEGSLQSTDEVCKNTEGSLQSTDEVCKSTEGSLQSTDEGCKSTEGSLQSKDEGCKHADDGLQSTYEGCELADNDLQSLDEGCKSKEESLQSTDEGCKRTEDGLQSTDEGCEHADNGLQSLDEGCKSTEEGLQSTDEGCKHADDGPQSTDEGIQHREEGSHSTNEGCKFTEESLQLKVEGEVNEKDSLTQIRKRRREERKQKITDLVENIKKNVKREEDAKVWKSRLKNTLVAVAVCSVAYITFRYFTSG